MQGIEAVVIGQRDVSLVVQEQRQHVVPLLGDGVVQRRVSLRVLPTHTHMYITTAIRNGFTGDFTRGTLYLALSNWNSKNIPDD